MQALVIFSSPPPTMRREQMVEIILATITYHYYWTTKEFLPALQFLYELPKGSPYHWLAAEPRYYWCFTVPQEVTSCEMERLALIREAMFLADDCKWSCEVWAAGYPMLEDYVDSHDLKEEVPF